MATLFQNYNTGDDTEKSTHGIYWTAQTFTPSITHTITSVRLLLVRLGSPGDITVSIKDTIAHRPSGEDLCFGTTSGNTLGTTTSEWREITLGSGTPLTSGTKYAIVVRVLAGNPTNAVKWRADDSAPSYTGGWFLSTNNSGGSWTYVVGTDMMFEEWGAGGVGSASPTVTTQAITKQSSTAAIGEGNITSLGSSAVTAHGHVWSTSPYPDLGDTSADNGAAYQTGSFETFITHLTPGETYYFRAWATNSYGTDYGSDVTITLDSTVQRRFIWTEEGFHFFNWHGAERKVEGVGVTSDKDIIYWLY